MMHTGENDSVLICGQNRDNEKKQKFVVEVGLCNVLSGVWYLSAIIAASIIFCLYEEISTY